MKTMSGISKNMRGISQNMSGISINYEDNIQKLRVELENPKIMSGIPRKYE
jgi:hypothetical protein